MAFAQRFLNVRHYVSEKDSGVLNENLMPCSRAWIYIKCRLGKQIEITEICPRKLLITNLDAIR